MLCFGSFASGSGRCRSSHVRYAPKATFGHQNAIGRDWANSDISQLLFDHLVRAVLSNAVEIKGERPGSGQQKPIARKRQKSDIKTKGAGRSACTGRNVMIPRVSTGPLLAGILCLWAANAFAQQQMAPTPAAPAPAAMPAPATPAPAAALPPGSPLIGRPENNEAAAKLAPVAPPPLATAADKIQVDQLKAPKGFSIELYASGMPNARSLALGDKGTVFVGSRLQDKVYAIVDKNGKREAKVLVSGLYRPNGVAFKNGTLYIAELSQISKIDNVEDKLDSSPKPTVIYSDLPKDEAHGWKFLAIGPDNRLYFNVGAPCNICMPPPTNAQLRSIATDGSDAQIIAHGIRQVVGMDFNPTSKVLYFTENQRDWLSEDEPQDKLNRLLNPGKDNFGFPIATAAISRIPNSGGVIVARSSLSRLPSSARIPHRLVCASIPGVCFRRSTTTRSSSPGMAPGTKPTRSAATSTSSISIRMVP